MGRYGNSASLEDITWTAGCSKGSMERYTKHCFNAIKKLHSVFVRKLAVAEKEVEKQWIDRHLGFIGSWQDGWVMYDGTIIVLYAKPSANGHMTRSSTDLIFVLLAKQNPEVLMLCHFTNELPHEGGVICPPVDIGQFDLSLLTHDTQAVWRKQRRNRG
jgi:hypothetical protein